MPGRVELEDGLTTGFENVLTAANLGIVRFYQDIPPDYDASESPSLVIWVSRWDEDRVAGPQEFGLKLAVVIVSLVLSTFNDEENTATGGKFHRDLLGQILDAVRHSAFNSLGAQVTDRFRYIRQPPLADGQSIAYLTYVEVECEIYTEG